MNAKNGSTPFNTECYLFHLLLTTLGLPKATSLSTPAIPWEDCALAAVFFCSWLRLRSICPRLAGSFAPQLCAVAHITAEKTSSGSLALAPLFLPRQLSAVLWSSCLGSVSLFVCHMHWVLFCDQIPSVWYCFSCRAR